MQRFSEESIIPAGPTPENRRRGSVVCTLMKPPACPQCSYDLRGLDDGSRKCPECGEHIEFDPFSVPARPVAAIQLSAIVQVGLVVAAVVSLVTLIRIDYVLTSKPHSLLLTLPALGVIAYAAFEPWRSCRKRPPCVDWPCSIQCTPNGLRVAGCNLNNAPLDFTISWRSLRSVDYSWNEWGFPVVCISARRFDDDCYQPPASFHLSPVEPPRPKRFYLNSSNGDIRRMFDSVNWFARACRTAKPAT